MFVQPIENGASRDTLFSPGLNMGRQKHLLAKAAINEDLSNLLISAAEN